MKTHRKCNCQGIIKEQKYHHVQSFSTAATITTAATTSATTSAAVTLTGTTTALHGVASKLYDMDAITRSTTDFRDKFASLDTDTSTSTGTTSTAPKKKKKINHGIGTSNSSGCSLGLYLPYESALQVLRTYHSQNGHLVIPRRFTIPPTSAYPKKWHHVYLASTVYNMKWWSKHVRSNPDRVKELNTLGFVWERLQPEWNLVLEALVIYKSLFGHTKVPSTFIVPFGESYWPMATWGIPLGNCVHRIRTRGDFLRDDEVAWSRRRQLDGLDFVWDVQEHAFEKFFTALRIYAKLEQLNTLIMSMPSSSSSTNTNASTNTNNGSGVKSNSNSGINIGVQKSGGRRIGQNDGDRKNRVQYQRSKALRIPQSFVVPSTSHLENGRINPWPKELWGYPLGIKCAAIRQKELYIKNNPERQRALQELGFQMSGNATIGWLNIVWASAIYSKIHGKGTLDVPINFVVPSLPSSNDELNADRNMDSYSNDDAWPWPGTYAYFVYYFICFVHG